MPKPNVVQRAQPHQYVTEEHFGVSVPTIRYASPAPMATDLLEAFDDSLSTITKFPDWDFVSPIATLRTVEAVIKQCPDDELINEFRCFCTDKRFSGFIPLDSFAGAVMLGEDGRGFDHVYLPNSNYVELPARQSLTSPGYVFKLPYEVEFLANTLVYIPTGIKAYMPTNNYLTISLLPKPSTFLAMPACIIAADYAKNEKTGGEIVLRVYSNNKVTIPRGYPLAEGIFHQYETTALDVPKPIKE